MSFKKLILICSLTFLATLSTQLYAFPEKSCDCSCRVPIPLTEPNLSFNDFNLWIKEAAISAFSYDYHDYHQALSNASRFFTPLGWQEFLAAFNQSGNLAMVLRDKLSVRAMASGPPVILENKIIDEHYMWVVEIPLTVSYFSEKSVQKQPLTVRMTIIRTGPAIGLQEMGINHLVAEPITKKIGRA